MMRTILLGCAAAAALIAGAATAQPIEEILIVGGLEAELPQELARVGVRVETVTGTEIENFGYNDIAQILQAQVPGLFVAPKNGAFDYVAASFQGSRINEILWLVDGVRVSNRLYNTTSPLDTLPAHMVERIEVVEGGQGLFYGTGAVSSVVNIVTKDFADALGGQFSAGMDSNDGRHIYGWVRDSIAGHRFVLYASNDAADGYRPFPEADYQPSTTDRERGYEVFVLGAKYAFDFTPDARFSAQWQRSDVTLDNLRPARSSLGQVGGMAAAFNERIQNLATAKFDYAPMETLELFVKGYYHSWDAWYNERRNVIGSPGTQRVISDHEFWGFKDYGVNLLAKVAVTDGVEAFAGYDFQNYSGRDDVLLIAENTETVHAFFGQLRATELLPNTALAAGLRYNVPDHTDSTLIWNLSGQHNFGENFFVRANGGTAFRLPDAYELFAIDPFCCFGNPDLKPEKSLNFNGSVGGRFDLGMGELTLEAIGFYREIEDLIVDVDDGTGSGNTITANVDDKVKVKGFVLVGSAAFTEALSATVSYTYTNSEGSSGVAGGYENLPGIPRDQFQATLDFHPMTMPFGASIAVNHVGEIVDNVAGFGRVPSGNYTTVDVAARVFVDNMRRHRLNLRVENVFDEDYTTLHARGFPDAAPFNQYLVHNLGTPQTFHLSYTFNY